MIQYASLFFSVNTGRLRKSWAPEHKSNVNSIMKIGFALISASTLGISVAMIVYNTQFPMTATSVIPIWSVTMVGIFYGFLALFAAINDAKKK